MKVKELVAGIENKDFNLEKELQVKTYLPIELKKTIAQSIIYDCTESDNGVIKVDSVQRYMSYVKYMITSHTNLEYTDEDYDTLCSLGLLNIIMDCFEADAKECSRILNLMTDDYMQEMSIDFAVAKFLNNLTGNLNNITENIVQKTNETNLNDIVPDSIDMNKLGDFLQNYIK